MKSRKWARSLGVVGVGLGLVAVQLAAGGSAGASSLGGHGRHDGKHGYTCTGGTIPAGHYWSLTVTGVCYAPSGDVNVARDVTVAPGALLDAVSPGDPTTGTPVVPATVNIGGNVFVGNGAVLLFGCSPQISCGNPPGVTFDHIGGSLIALGAQGVVVHSATIGGNVYVLGGGGGAAADTCNAQAPGAPTVTNLEPWSLDPGLYFTPVYTDVEDTTIGGSLKIANLDSCWLGTLRDQVGRDAWISNNNMGDPDAMEVGSNLIGGDLGCVNNTPAVQFGDGGAAPSIVRHHAFGQCGFSVTVPNPSAASGGPGVSEHVSTSAWKLKTYHATYTPSAAEVSLPPVTTASGDTLNAAIYSFALTSTKGLSGTGTYDSSQPLGASGAAILSTTFANGWSSFMGYLNCSCSFGGQSGAVAIRVYGTTSPNGQTWGNFIVTSGGGLTAGSLSTMAGYGSFSSHGQSSGALSVTEHVEIT